MGTLALRLFLPLVLAVLGAPAPAAAPSPASVGGRAAAAWLDRPEFMIYQVGEVTAVHYAEVASAYGAARLARASANGALLERVAARHRRLLAEAIPNSANHVDANVYGLWPLVLDGDEERARGLAMADGQWQESGPDGLTRQARYWIDDIWMIGALQVQAWRVTGEGRYLDRAAQTARLYVSRLQQPNGLFHHGPEAPFFWGRGNGWVAAGLAEILSELPADHPDRPALAAAFRRMMAALLRHQAEDGMWRQLIDYPDAWKETSATAMFGYAMAVGVRRGILAEPAYVQAHRRAWTALAAYVGADGQLSQVCAGTGQSADADYYLARPVVTGDLHGQAALLWFAAELAEARAIRR
ncbi:glycoside hydrolase family 88/105 protein [Sphingosinicella terrae]|uniref:glycoside hydrolase family 88/105 protein n=1 Tax=Sphingosinicella terrae TaxID=2172047 RepID=UPI000E0CDFD2|nr:glycoside hydrolase family 88 protein [Sphingosinicella terrae]